MAVITCTHCGATGNAPDQILGQQVRCSKRKQSFVAGGSPPAPVSSIPRMRPRILPTRQSKTKVFRRTT